MKAVRLDDGEIASGLGALPLWAREDNAIRREFGFRSFADAMVFINAVAEVAEEINHHPEWSNVYNKVTIRLTTHSCGGLSRLDFELAARIDRIADQVYG